MTTAGRWVSWPRLALTAPADTRLAAHLADEYGPPLPIPHATGLRLVPSRPTSMATSAAEGGHKGTRWTLVATPPDGSPVEAWVRVRGPFGLALLQSQVIEPLLAAIIARPDRALVPAAGIRNDRTVELVVGESGAGKTSLAMRAAASGWIVLGDDRVFVGPAGVEGFRRRHRVYPDATETASDFVGVLDRGDRRALALRAATSALTRGFVRLPVLVQPSQWQPGPFPVERITLLVRDSAPPGWRDDLEALTDRLALVIDRDRRAITSLGGAWPAALAAARMAELEAVRGAGRAAVVRVVVSPRGEPADAVERVAAAFGIRS